jgi:hypothetical protein
VKSLTTEAKPIPEEPKRTEPEKAYPTGDDFQNKTEPKYWFGFLKKYADSWEIKSGQIDSVKNLTDWSNFPHNLLSFLRTAFRQTHGGLSCVGFWEQFRFQNLYKLAYEVAQGQ